MVKTSLLFCLLLWGLGLRSQALPLYDNPGTTAVAQDGAGNVWALPENNSGQGTLRRWQRKTGAAKIGIVKAEAWTIETIPGAAGLQPLTLTRGGGFVYVFWQEPNQGHSPSGQCLVTVQRGVYSRILARFSVPTPEGGWFPEAPGIYAGPEGDVWISGNSLFLWHISLDGIATSFPLKSEQYFDSKLPTNYSSHTLSSVIDGAGHRWFWQNRVSGNWQLTTLHGVLIWDGKTLGYHAVLPGMPDQPFSVVAPLDQDHVWLATGDDFQHPLPLSHGALYRVDIHTLTAVEEKPPLPGAFQKIVQIFQAGGDTYIVEKGQPWQKFTVWRERAGQWRKCLENSEEVGGYYEPDLRYPWLAEPDGIWLGVRSGAWWLPHKDLPAVWVDWRRGLEALNLSGLFPLMDGRILAFSSQGAAALMAATPQPLRPLPPGLTTGGLGAPKYVGLLLTDLRRHLWGTRTSYSGSYPLDEWDGQHWRTHLAPKGVSVSGLYACDTRGRIWLTTSRWNPPTQPQPVEGRLVYDPAQDTWTNYETVDKALQAAALIPSMAFLPYHNTYFPPIFSGDGRVAYVMNNTTVFLFDGLTWHHWEAHDIVPGYSYGNLSDNPHFNRSGHLEVGLNNQIWEWTLSSGWQPSGKQIVVKNEDPVPPGGPLGLWAIPVTDSLGRKWFPWKGDVYTAWHGLWVKQTELSGPGSPFGDGRGIDDVLQDPAGRFFILTRPTGYYDLLVWSPPPVPKPQVSVTLLDDDTFQIRFRSQTPGSNWLLWRLNGGAWSAPQKMGAVTLAGLPHGDYRIEVQALDRRLQPSPSAVAVFHVRVAAAAQIARWVSALLQGTDDQREVAVAGLVQQPAAALPALQAALPGASDAARWWIEATIQQIQDRDQRD